MQLTYNFIQNFLPNKIYMWVHRVWKIICPLQNQYNPLCNKTRYTNLFHPVKFCVWFTSAANGSHSATQKGYADWIWKQPSLMRTMHYISEDYVTLNATTTSQHFFWLARLPVVQRVYDLWDLCWNPCGQWGFLFDVLTTLPSLLFVLSTDLDTSEDLSAELDRSHGFFTASGDGERMNYVKWLWNLQFNCVNNW